MYYVMSAEEVDGHNEPFLHAICEDKSEAREAVTEVVRSLELFDPEVKPGLNDCDKWADERWDENGLTAWSSSGGRSISVMAKYVGTVKPEVWVCV